MDGFGRRNWPDLVCSIFSAMLVTEKRSSSAEAIKFGGESGRSGDFRCLVAGFIVFSDGEGRRCGKGERGAAHGVCCRRWIFHHFSSDKNRRNSNGKMDFFLEFLSVFVQI